MSRFAGYSHIHGDGPDVDMVRLTGDGWFIEVSKHDEHTVEVRCGGSMSVLLSVAPRSANVVHVTTDVEYERRVHAAAVRVAEVWKQNENSPLRRKGRK